MRELHLFAGCGGGVLGGMLLGHRPVCLVENVPWLQALLRERFGVPVFGDVREFDGRPWRGLVDIVAGGFPCQPWSSAGRRLGAADPRHLWPEMARIVAEVRPALVFAENVQARAFEEPYADLCRMGYRVAPLLTLGAGDLGAPYQRRRCWLLAADTDSQGERVIAEHAQMAGARAAGHAGGGRLPVPENREAAAARLEIEESARAAWRAALPRLRRLVSRVSPRVDPEKRIRAAGNAQVPQVAAAAFALLLAELARS